MARQSRAVRSCQGSEMGDERPRHSNEEHYRLTRGGSEITIRFRSSSVRASIVVNGHTFALSRTVSAPSLFKWGKRRSTSYTRTRPRDAGGASRISRAPIRSSHSAANKTALAVLTRRALRSRFSRAVIDHLHALFVTRGHTCPASVVSDLSEHVLLVVG
jgi:hypothetical protein